MNDYVAVDVTPTTPQTHPEEWAAYERKRAAITVQVIGKPGRCKACGRFLGKEVWTNAGFPPTMMWGRVDFDPGCIEHIYHCTNPDCMPDGDY